MALNWGHSAQWDPIWREEQKDRQARQGVLVEDRHQKAGKKGSVAAHVQGNSPVARERTVGGAGEDRGDDRSRVGS